jgi:opacity protein-like surface antigen
VQAAGLSELHQTSAQWRSTQKRNEILERLMMRSLFCALVATLMVAAPAAAQSDKPQPFALVNFGFQPRSQDVTQSAEFTIYDETGTAEARHSLEGAPFFEFGGGIGVRRNFSVGASFARRSTKSRDVLVTAGVPSPVGTDELRTATATLQGVEHQESALHLQAIWHVPVTEEFEVAVFAGPSIFFAKHDLIDNVEPIEVGDDLDFSQVNINVTKSSESETALGINLGVDGRYMVTPRIGAGVMIRFARGSVDFAPPGGKVEFNTGGLEIAGGLRFKF